MSNARQELYDRIRQTSKMEVILADMTRLGFWKPDSGEHAVPDELIKREKELRKELNSLVAQQNRFENRDQALADMRKKRLMESRQKRRDTKLRNKAQRLDKAEKWRLEKEQQIFYLGAGVSTVLGKQENDIERLRAAGLPTLVAHRALALSLDLTMSELRFLAYHREISNVSHYKTFLMPKKRGGFRRISAPMPRLKKAQSWILENILNTEPLREPAHGFRPGRSIVSNAELHKQQDIVVNLDLENFFPTVTFQRVSGVFHSLGYSPSMATILALLCTELPSEEIELDGKTWFVATGDRALPQGGPTSPAITNIICRRMDARLSGIARKHGYVYTRYADDLTFSASGQSVDNLTKLLWHVKKVVSEEGFIVHPDKQRIMRRGRRQEVTGLVVNDAVTVPRADVRAFRSLLHHMQTKGVAGAHFKGSGDNLLDRVHGFASFLHMVDPERYAKLITRAKTVLDAQGYSPQPVKPAPSSPPPIPESARTSAQAPAERDKASDTGEMPIPEQPKKGGFWSKVKKMFGDD
jgi:retron-type reverse transcriptase